MELANDLDDLLPEPIVIQPISMRAWDVHESDANSFRAYSVNLDHAYAVPSEGMYKLISFF